MPRRADQSRAGAGPAAGPVADTGPVLSNIEVAARGLILDRAAAAVFQRLSEVRIDAILLKGAVTAAWLYSGEARLYRDVDVLVAPDRVEDATKALADIGYRYRMADADPAERGPKERELFGAHDVCIDLHHGFVGMTASPEHCWDILAACTEPFEVGGGTVLSLVRPARAMHLALHAAQNGPIDVKALADLERGLKVVDLEDWQEAARLAEALGATEAMAAGLRLVPAGAAVAEKLALPQQMTVELAIRSHAATQDALFFERLRATPGLKRKASLVARKLFPTTTYMRVTFPSALRGPLGLAWAWVSRLGSLARRFPRAFAAWRAARLAARSR